MSQVPTSFHSASIPLTPTQWTHLHRLLQTQITTHAHVRKGPNPAIQPGTSTTDPWYAWLERFIGSDEVRLLLDLHPTAAIWASPDGRARILEAVKPVAVVMAWIERVSRREFGGYTDQPSGEGRSGSGQGPDSGAGDGGSAAAGAALGPPFVISIT